MVKHQLVQRAIETILQGMYTSCSCIGAGASWPALSHWLAVVLGLKFYDPGTQLRIT